MIEGANEDDDGEEQGAHRGADIDFDELVTTEMCEVYFPVHHGKAIQILQQCKDPKSQIVRFSKNGSLILRFAVVSVGCAPQCKQRLGFQKHFYRIATAGHRPVNTRNLAY